jgi:putative redox protein
MKTITTWKTGHAFESFQHDSKIEVDAKNGFGPKALLLTGLAACSGIDVVDILEKMRVPFADLKIEAEAEQTEEHPRVFKTIQLKYHVKADRDQLEKIHKAIDLSLEKYCGVAAMLKKNSEIQYSVKLEDLT